MVEYNTMLKTFLMCKEESERISELIECIFDKHISVKCEHYEGAISGVPHTHPLCNNRIGDGICCLSTCPLKARDI